MGTYLARYVRHVPGVRQVVRDGVVAGDEIEQLLDGQRLVLRRVEDFDRLGLEGLLGASQERLHEVDVDALHRRQVVAEVDGEEAGTTVG